MMTNSQIPNPNKSHYAAAMAYGATQDGTMSGFAVVAELYKGMIRFVGQAKKSYEVGRLDDMCQYISKVNKILIALQSNLNFEEGGRASVVLNDLYMEVFKRLTFILRTENPAAEFDAVHDILKPMAQIWNAHAENAKKDNPDTHVEMPVIPQS